MRKLSTASNRPQIPPIPDNVKRRLSTFRSVPLLAPVKPKYRNRRRRMSNTSKDQINLLHAKLSKRKLPNRRRLSVDGVFGQQAYITGMAQTQQLDAAQTETFSPSKTEMTTKSSPILKLTSKKGSPTKSQRSGKSFQTSIPAKINVRSTSDKDIMDLITKWGSKYPTNRFIRFPKRYIQQNKLESARLKTSQNKRMSQTLQRDNSLNSIKSFGSEKIGMVDDTKPKLPKVVHKISFRSKTGHYGGREKLNNQDSYFYVPRFAQVHNQSLAAVCDGHGVNGHDISDAIKKSFPLQFATVMPHMTSTTAYVPELEAKAIKKAFSAAVINLGNEILARRDLEIEESGSTMVACFIRGNLLFWANVGDSKAVLGRQKLQKWESIVLSNDHKPEDPKEAHRIQSFGGLVAASKDIDGRDIGPLRIWVPGSNPPVPGLAMTRAIGDKIARQIGLIYKPEIKEHRLTQEDKFLIIASDGIWEFITPQDAVDIVSAFWEKGRVAEAWEELISKATEMWKYEDEIIDDITVIIIYLKCDF